VVHHRAAASHGVDSANDYNRNHDRDHDDGYLHAGIKLNQVDTLDIHPYAVGAPSLFLELVQGVE